MKPILILIQNIICGPIHFAERLASCRPLDLIIAYSVTNHYNEYWNSLNCILCTHHANQETSFKISSRLFLDKFKGVNLNYSMYSSNKREKNKNT